MVRPSASRDSCPNGFLPCNEEFFASGNSEYVVCYNERSDDKDSVCPITSFAFEVAEEEKSLYEFIENPSFQPASGSLRGIYASKKIASHGI